MKTIIYSTAGVLAFLALLFASGGSFQPQIAKAQYGGNLVITGTTPYQYNVDSSIYVSAALGGINPNTYLNQQWFIVTCNITSSSQSNTVLASGGGYVGSGPEGSDWYPVSCGVDTSALPNGTYSLTMTAFYTDGLSPLPGSNPPIYPSGTEGWTAPSIQITVKHQNGTVTVMSENSVLTSDIVPSSWYFPVYPSLDPCSVSACQGTSSTYASMPLGTYGLQPSYTIGSAAGMYSLHSVELQPVAKRQGNLFLSLLQDLSDSLSKARAAVVCGFVDNGASSCPINTQTLSLANSGDTANFTILWDPMASIGVNPTAVSSTVTAPAAATMNATIQNSGAPGSTLDWSASTSSLPSWLTVSPMSGCLDAGGVAANGCSDTSGSQTLTLTANSSGLATGTYTGTVTIDWNSLPSPLPNPSPKTIAVTFAVGAVPPSVSLSASPASVASGGSSTLTWSSSGASSCAASASPSSASWSGSEPLSGSQSVSPADTTAYSLSCTGTGGTTSQSATVTVGAASSPPNCTFGSNPQQIVPPEASALSWSCTNVVSCTLDGTAVGVTGNEQVSPAADTTYTLTCQGSGSGSTNTVTAETTVTTGGPNVQEVNP